MLSPRWKLFLVVTLAWLAIVCGCQLLYYYQVEQIQADWPAYRNRKLHSILCSIQNEFSRIETTSFQILGKLLNETPVMDEMVYWKPGESPTRLFRYVHEFALPNARNNRGIAIYNYQRFCVAWRNCDFNPAPHLLDECLKGARFSTVVKSGHGVFVVLCTFVPIPHPTLREYVGVAVAFSRLDCNYPLSTRYIKSQSFAQKMKQRHAIQDIVIDYENQQQQIKGKGNLLAGPLQNLNGQQLGWISLIALPQDVTIQRIAACINSIQQVSTALLVLFALIFLLRQPYRSPGVGIGQAVSALALLWTARYALHYLNFPGEILPAFFNAPDVFYFLAFGRLGDSLGNLVVTALTFLLSALIWRQWRPSLPKSPRKHYRYPLVIVVAIAMVLTVLWLDGYLCEITLAIVKHANFQLFDFTNVLPSVKVLAIYFVILSLGLTTLFLTAWVYSHLVLLLRSILSKRMAYLSLLAIIAASTVSFPYPGGELRQLYICCSTCLAVAALLWLWQLPKRQQLRTIVLLAIIALAVYPLLDYATQQKYRALIMDRAEEFQEQFAQDTVELSLDLFENDKNLAEAIAQRKYDIAFLLWARSPLSERLDNLELLIYANADASKSAGKMLHDKPLSHFSLNMPNPFWYRPLRRRLRGDKRQSLASLPGYGDGKNILFYMGGVPVRNSKGNLLGFVVIFTRQPQLARPLPLPEVFTKKEPLPISPLLVTYFEDKNLIHTNNPYMARDFELSDRLLTPVQESGKSVWQQEDIQEQRYDCYYFPRLVKKRVIADNGRYQIISKEDVAMLAYPLPSLLSRIFYLLQFFLAGVLFFLLPILLYYFIGILWHHPARLYRISFEHKILLSFLLVSGIPVVIMGMLSKQKAVDQIWKSYTRNLTEYLQNAEKAIREDTYLPLSAEETTERMPDDRFCQVWGERHGKMLNVYLLSSPFLLATNRRELFHTELLPTRISGKVFYHLMLLRKDIYITLERLADYTFVVGYKAIYSPFDRRQVVGALSLPMIYKQSEAEQQIARIIATIFTVYAAIFLLVMVIGVVLAHQITMPLTRLIAGIHRVSAGELDFTIPVSSTDELGQVVASFNRMTKDLKISRQKLVQAEKDAAWREMARQIAHEIKNPLTPMKLSAQHIQRAYRDRADSFELILDKGTQTIIDAIDSLSKTATSFSEFARFTRPTLGTHQIASILQECLDLFTHYREQNIVIEAKIAADLPKVIVDPHQLKRVVINILTNAVQAMVNISDARIRLTANELQENQLLIMVQDNGVGIPDVVKPRLFEPNFSTKSHGSGLGLAICKRAIEYMGGEIAIDSEEGNGTRVSITLQIAVPANPPDHFPKKLRSNGDG